MTKILGWRRPISDSADQGQWILRTRRFDTWSLEVRMDDQDRSLIHKNDLKDINPYT